MTPQERAREWYETRAYRRAFPRPLPARTLGKGGAHVKTRLTERVIRDILGPHCHIERGNADGEWVVNSVACWTVADVRRIKG